MIYDCFTFYNELELLEIRLNILNDVVDKFVLIENIVTYTNQKKPLYYQKNKARYKKFHNKIIHVIVRDAPNVSHPWIIEHYLMAAAKRGLKNAKPNDTILISNLDEIPRPEKISEWINKPGKLKVFEQQFFYYYLNFASTNKKWLGTKMLKFKDFLKYQDAYVIRHSPNVVVIKNGGWHFSYMGDIKRMLDKVATGSHQEYNNDNYNTKERFTRALLEKRDPFGHNDRFDFVAINVLPKYIQDNKEKYEDMFLERKRSIPLKKQYITFLEIKHFLRIKYRSLRKKLFS